MSELTPSQKGGLDGVLSLRLKTSRFTPGGYVTTSYTPAEVDAICAYSPALNRSFLVPIDEACGRRSIHLRLDPSKNSQAKGIRWADDYELETMIRRRRFGVTRAERR